MAAEWQIVSQKQTTQLVGGSFADAMQVSFETDDGTTGSITVPLSAYSTESVANAIQARVDAIKAVKAL